MKYLRLALEALDLPAGQIERLCNEALGEEFCTAKQNDYMRVTLYKLLGGHIPNKPTARKKAKGSKKDKKAAKKWE